MNFSPDTSTPEPGGGGERGSSSDSGSAVADRRPNAAEDATAAASSAEDATAAEDAAAVSVEDAGAAEAAAVEEVEAAYARLSPRARAYDRIYTEVSALQRVETQMSALMATRATHIDTIRILNENAVATYQSEYHDGWDSESTAERQTTSEVATALHIPQRTAQTLIQLSHDLIHHFPTTHTALTGGQISYRHAVILIDEAWTLPEEAWAAFEYLALPVAKKTTAARFVRVARTLREQSHPDSIRVRKQKSVNDRYVRVEPAYDGMAYLSLYLQAEDALGIYNRATDIALSLKTKDEKRTLSQLRVDVLNDLMLTAHTRDGAGAGITATVLVTVPALTLLEHTTNSERTTNTTDSGTDSSADTHTTTDTDTDPGADTDTTTDPGADTETTRDGRNRRHRRSRSRGRNRGDGHDHTDSDSDSDSAGAGVGVPLSWAAMLEGYGPIDIDTATRLAGTAKDWIRLLTHPETGTVLSVGTSRYRVPADMRRWLQIRDHTCRFPGCNRRAVDCDIDHTLDWQYGGATECINLACLCKKDHGLKHHTGWSVTQDRMGILTWVSPAGLVHITEPNTHLPTGFPHPNTPPPEAPTPTPVVPWVNP